MEVKKDEIYDNLEQLEIVLEKSFTIIPIYLSAVKVNEINIILKRLYDCVPLELKNSESNFYNLLKQFEYIVNNSFPILPNYLAAIRVGKLEQIIDQIYATIPGELSSNGTENFCDEKCIEKLQPSLEMRILIILGKIIKPITPIIQIVIIVTIIVYVLGIDKCHNILLEIVNNISK